MTSVQFALTGGHLPYNGQSPKLAAGVVIDARSASRNMGSGAPYSGLCCTRWRVAYVAIRTKLHSACQPRHRRPQSCGQSASFTALPWTKSTEKQHRIAHGGQFE